LMVWDPAGTLLGGEGFLKESDSMGRQILTRIVNSDTHVKKRDED
jgi:hypothetical protein